MSSSLSIFFIFFASTANKDEGLLGAQGMASLWRHALQPRGPSSLDLLGNVKLP